MDLVFSPVFWSCFCAGHGQPAYCQVHWALAVTLSTFQWVWTLLALPASLTRFVLLAHVTPHSWLFVSPLASVLEASFAVSISFHLLPLDCPLAVTASHSLSLFLGGLIESHVFKLLYASGLTFSWAPDSYINYLLHITSEPLKLNMTKWELFMEFCFSSHSCGPPVLVRSTTIC